MKYQLLFTFAFCTISMALFSQTDSELKSYKRKPATVLNWEKHAMTFSQNYWDDKNEQILKQISAEEFEKVKSNIGWQKVPAQMSLWDGETMKRPEIVISKLQKLTAYKIATYNHYHQGMLQGRYVILEVPYEENKTWDTTAKWDTVYFVLPEAVVKP